MEDGGRGTLLNREEIPGKLRNQRLWNIISLILGFTVVLSLSWFSIASEGWGFFSTISIKILTCFPGVLIALLIAEFLSRIMDR